jgi:hypothetical protein
MAANRLDQHSEEPDVRLPDIEQPRVGHEESDVNVWAVGKFGIGLVLGFIAALALVIGVFRYFQSHIETQPPSAVVQPNVDARSLPPEPRLQTTPVLDLQQMRAAEDSILNGYGWVDRMNNVVRIPIGRAIDLLAARGLPARASAPPPASTAGVPTESGLGPEMAPPGGPLAEPRTGQAPGGQ